MYKEIMIAIDYQFCRDSNDYLIASSVFIVYSSLWDWSYSTYFLFSSGDRQMPHKAGIPNIAKAIIKYIMGIELFVVMATT